MKFSHSRVDTFKNCPYKFKLDYIDNLDTLPDGEPDNALIVGTMVHSAIEKDLNEAIQEYYMSYPIIDDRHINEVYKLELLHPTIMEIIEQAFPGKKENEVLLETDDFKGFIDLLVHNEDDTVNIIDFKYSNNIDNYMQSGQLHEYKYFYEKIYKKKVKHLLFLFIPKVQVKQKQDEDLFSFRKRIKSELSKMQMQIKEVSYDPNKVIEFMLNIKNILEEKEFPKNPSYLCKWCKFQLFCQENKNYMIIQKEEFNMLPSSERRVLGKRKKRKIWIYGAPTSGKTTMLDDSPNPLNLNTDGNIEEVTMPAYAIKDIVTVEGRQTKRKLAWEVFKEAIDELEKKQNDFKTIIIDLIEDTREMCRIFKYKELGIQHESDSSYGKGWDIIKTEYLSTMRRFFNLDYENLIIVSHEDISKDITKTTGDKITRIAPNIQDALATKLAGMVDIVARVVIEDDDSRTLNFKANEVIFGGSRLKGLNVSKIPLAWQALVDLYDNRNSNLEIKEESKPGRRAKKEEPKEEEKNFTEEVQQVEQVEEQKVEQNEQITEEGKAWQAELVKEEPKQRRSKKNNEKVENETVIPEEVKEETVKRTRKPRS